jgi:glutaminyl-tRNA synthetase
MIDEETISSKIAKQVFEQMVQNGENPEDIVQAKGLVQISDPSVIEPLIDEVIAKNQDNVAKYKAGNKNLFGFFVGAVLKATAGKANPKIVNELVAKKLENA